MSLQAIDPSAEVDNHVDEVGQQPRLTVADALKLPALCGGKEVAALWGITPSRFHKLNRRGAYNRFKVTPAIGPRCFSGVLLGRYLSGEPLILPTFGRKRSI